MWKEIPRTRKKEVLSSHLVESSDYSDSSCPSLTTVRLGTPVQPIADPSSAKLPTPTCQNRNILNVIETSISADKEQFESLSPQETFSEKKFHRGYNESKQSNSWKLVPLG